MSKLTKGYGSTSIQQILTYLKTYLTGKFALKTNIPTKVSDLTNDSGFITKIVDDLVNYYLKSEIYSKSEVDALVTAIKNSRFESVNTLPTEDIKTNVIYLVPSSDPQASNIKDEYINLDGTTTGWEKIGSTEIDLSGYVTTTQLNTALANYVTSTNLTTILADYATTASVTSAISTKVDKVSNATAGNFAGLDASGNLTDSGKKATDFADLTTLAPEFNTTTAYGVGEYVTYDGSLYRFTSAHSAGAWNSNRVVEIKAVGQYVTAGKKSGTELGLYATAEGVNTEASSAQSHAEGYGTTASGTYSHAEGYNTVASDISSHAEGYNTEASGAFCHAEGWGTVATDDSSHAEGNGSEASGSCSHAEGKNTTASGYYSHAEGRSTIAQRESQTVIGEYNIADTTGADGTVKGEYAFIIGNGTSNYARSNALTVDWDGNLGVAGSVYGTNLILVNPVEYTSADCNSWTNKGVYQGVDAYNSPVSGWITVVTIPMGSNNFNYCEQKLFPLNSNAVYSRYRNMGTWSGWTRIDGGAGWTEILSGTTSESDYHQLNITNIKSNYSELIVCIAVASHTDDYVYTFTISTNAIDVLGKIFYGTKFESPNDYNMGYIQFDTSNSRVKVCNCHNGSSISSNFKVYAK